jgi:hypothetical protein
MMAAGFERIPELVIDLIVPPALTGLWLLFVSINDRIVDRKGKGSRIDAHPWRLLIETYLVVFVLTLVRFLSR